MDKTTTPQDTNAIISELQQQIATLSERLEKSEKNVETYKGLYEFESAENKKLADKLATIKQLCKIL